MSPDGYTLRALDAARPGRAVAHYLIHSYLYYVLDAAIITDDTFDAVVRFIGAHWDRIEHPHKHLLDREMLKSGFHIREYPAIVVGSALNLKASYERPAPKRRGPAKGAVPKVPLEG